MEMFIADRKILLLLLFFASRPSMYTLMQDTICSANTEEITGCRIACKNVYLIFADKLDLIYSIKRVCPSRQKGIPITSLAKQRLVSLAQYVLIV